MNFKYYWSSEHLKNLLEELLLLVSKAEEVKNRNDYFDAIKNNIFYRSEIADYDKIYNLYLNIEDELQTLERVKSSLPQIDQIGDINKVSDILKVAILIDPEIFISGFTTVNSKYTLNQTVEILDDFIIEYNSHLKIFTKEVEDITKQFTLKKDLYIKIFDFSKNKKSILELLPNFKLLNYNEYSKSLLALSSIPRFPSTTKESYLVISL